MNLSQDANVYNIPVNGPGPEGEYATFAQIGYMPTWCLRLPPGIGDATQMVWSTWAAPVFDMAGVGDTPMANRQILPPPTWTGQKYLKSGMPTTSGGFWQSPLTFQPPINDPNQFQLPGHMY